MAAANRLPSFPLLSALFLLLAGATGCTHAEPRPAVTATLPSPPLAVAGVPAVRAPPARIYPVMLGIDVLQAENFAPIAGKRVGLLTHPAGVNRYGESTIDVLRHAPNVKLVALFGPEHGIYGDEKAEQPVPDRIDPRTGLPVYSLYGRYRQPTKQMLRGLDALVIDLQDIGVRSYTFSSCMKLAMEACFENGVEVVVLDRPDPLGGLKVAGPLMDRDNRSYVGAFPVPYVHGLTIGELARLAKYAPGVMDLPDSVRERGKLVVVPMRGWSRWMRWPDTGLRFVPTSPYIQDFAAVVGYAMVGLGTYIGGFTHGVGAEYPFRGINYKGKSPEQLQLDLEAFHIPGLQFHRVSVPLLRQQSATGLYVEVTDWDAWRPTELSFYMMKLACEFSRTNPFLAAGKDQASGFLHHVGSTAWWHAIRRDGARVNVAAFVREWQAQDKIYQEQSRRYWLYQ